MKKSYELVIRLLILCLVLTVLEGVLLYMAQDLKHIILISVVGAADIVILIILIILKLELNKILFEYKDEHLEIRTIDYEDFQEVRKLLCDEPLSNSQHEVELLREYEAQTVDMVRTRYHYIIKLDNETIGLFYAHDNTVEIIKVSQSEEEIINILKAISQKKKKEIEIK